RPRWLTAFLSVLLALAGANFTRAGETRPFAASPVEEPAFAYPGRPDELEDRVLDIFEAKCAFAGCHAGTSAPQGLDLTEEGFKASLINVKSSGLPKYLRVKPGDAGNSYLMGKIRGSAAIKGERMPKGAAPLSPEEIKTIEAWINSLAADLKVAAPRRQYAQAFYGWSLANLPTAEPVEKGAFMYRIAHRFKAPVAQGFDQLFGLDGGAFMMTQLAFPLTDDFTFSLARSGLNATFEIGGKWRFLRQKSDGSVPLSAALYAGVDWATLKGIPDPANPTAGNLSRTDAERFAIFGQVPITRQLGSRVSLAVVPGILLNGNVTVDGEDPLVTIGVGGKFAFNEKYALFSEIVPIVSGDETALIVGGPRVDGGRQVFNDTFVAGLEIKAGGHVFHLFVTNSGGNTTNQYLSGGNLDFADGDFRLGFNIYRILSYPF
ncbi:MAG: DUF5777 family beta-barrel protein, partial [candidate division KSB1 bacterium]|nr:DUF5777 family beta-barrel protein [candidate division KSB1 bacterium]